MAEPHVLTRCDQCGQTDNHPMAHFAGGRSVHHDCMGVDEETLARESSNGEALGSIIDACKGKDGKGGLRGDKLRAFIFNTEGGTL